MAFMILLSVGLSLYVVEQAVSPRQSSSVMHSRGEIRGIGVKVYSDSACSSKLSSINWGTMEPGESQNLTIYIRNEGNSAANLSLSTANWSPSNASQSMALTWDYDMKPIASNEVVKIVLTLAVSDTVSGVTDFSFDIIIVGTG